MAGIRLCARSLYAASSSTLMRSDLRNLRSWSLILNSVVIRAGFSLDFSPGLLTPIVASSTRKISYPPSLIRDTTSAIGSESASDSLIASPSSFINCFNCWSTYPPLQESDCRVFHFTLVPALAAFNQLDAATGHNVSASKGLRPRYCTPETPQTKPRGVNIDRIMRNVERLHQSKAGHCRPGRGPGDIAARSPHSHLRRGYHGRAR